MADFTPVLYVKDKCPFSMKPWLMCLESGIADRIEIKKLVPGADDEQAIRSELEPHLEKVTFPAAKVGPAEYMTDSDAIVQRLAGDFGIDTASLPAFTSYVTGPFQNLVNLYRENAELKKAQAA